jgi:elongation factor 1-gamma
MSSNLVGGFCQRVPSKLNSGTFGSMLIFGDEPNLEVHGAFLVRGHELPEMLKENPDFEVYDWSRVDLNDPEQKEWLEDLWGWDGKLKGKTFNDNGTVYK